MTDNPQRGSVNSVEIPYSPSCEATSRSEAYTRLALLAVWWAMFLVGLVYISRYALINPFVDEWAFVPVLFGDEPAGPWLWALHNEHRFPLPRIIYLALFWITGDLRTGCLVSFLGISMLAAGLMRLARTIRGRSSIADAVFPLMLMHTGQGENLYMGYQICFMLVTVLAGALLAVIVGLGERSRVSGPIVSTSGRLRGSARPFIAALLATLVGWLLLTCGAGGLVYGVTAAVWVVWLAIRGDMRPWQRGLLLALIPMTPAYIVFYSQGYVRPDHHPPSAGIVESTRIGLQAQAVALGPAATGMWPLVGIGIVVAAILVVALLICSVWQSRGDPRLVGLLLLVAAGGAVAFGIGWGRSGFHNDMGLAWRYGWITFPPIAAAYFTWLLRGGRVSAYGSAALAGVALLFAPINTISGFREAERKVLAFERAWEADVRAGLTADEIVNRHFREYHPSARRPIVEAMQLMREHRYAYYESLGRESP